MVLLERIFFNFFKKLVQFVLCVLSEVRVLGQRGLSLKIRRLLSRFLPLSFAFCFFFLFFHSLSRPAHAQYKSYQSDTFNQYSKYYQKVGKDLYGDEDAFFEQVMAAELAAWERENLAIMAEGEFTMASFDAAKDNWEAAALAEMTKQKAILSARMIEEDLPVLKMMLKLDVATTGNKSADMATWEAKETDFMADLQTRLQVQMDAKKQIHLDAYDSDGSLYPEIHNILNEKFNQAYEEQYNFVKAKLATQRNQFFYEISADNHSLKFRSEQSSAEQMVKKTMVAANEDAKDVQDQIKDLTKDVLDDQEEIIKRNSLLEALIAQGMRIWSRAEQALIQSQVKWEQQVWTDYKRGNAMWQQGYNELTAAKEKWLSEVSEEVEQTLVDMRVVLDDMKEEQDKAQKELEEIQRVTLAEYSGYIKDVKDLFTVGGKSYNSAKENVSWLRGKVKEMLFDTMTDFFDHDFKKIGEYSHGLEANMRKIAKSLHTYKSLPNQNGYLSYGKLGVHQVGNVGAGLAGLNNQNVLKGEYGHYHGQFSGIMSQMGQLKRLMTQADVEIESRVNAQARIWLADVTDYDYTEADYFSFAMSTYHNTLTPVMGEIDSMLASIATAKSYLSNDVTLAGSHNDVVVYRGGAPRREGEVPERKGYKILKVNPPAGQALLEVNSRDYDNVNYVYRYTYRAKTGSAEINAAAFVNEELNALNKYEEDLKIYKENLVSKLTWITNGYHEELSFPYYIQQLQKWEGNVTEMSNVLVDSWDLIRKEQAIGSNGFFNPTNKDKVLSRLGLIYDLAQKEYDFREKEYQIAEAVYAYSTNDTASQDSLAKTKRKLNQTLAFLEDLDVQIGTAQSNLNGPIKDALAAKAQSISEIAQSVSDAQRGFQHAMTIYDQKKSIYQSFKTFSGTSISNQARLANSLLEQLENTKQSYATNAQAYYRDLDKFSSVESMDNAYTYLSGKITAHEANKRAKQVFDDADALGFKDLVDAIIDGESHLYPGFNASLKVMKDEVDKLDSSDQAVRAKSTYAILGALNQVLGDRGSTYMADKAALEYVMGKQVSLDDLRAKVDGFFVEQMLEGYAKQRAYLTTLSNFVEAYDFDDGFANNGVLNHETFIQELDAYLVANLTDIGLEELSTRDGETYFHLSDDGRSFLGVRGLVEADAIAKIFLRDQAYTNGDGLQALLLEELAIQNAVTVQLTDVVYGSGVDYFDQEYKDARIDDLVEDLYDGETSYAESKVIERVLREFTQAGKNNLLSAGVVDQRLLEGLTLRKQLDQWESAEAQTSMLYDDFDYAQISTNLQATMLAGVDTNNGSVAFLTNYNDQSLRDLIIAFQSNLDVLTAANEGNESPFLPGAIRDLKRQLFYLRAIDHWQVHQNSSEADALALVNSVTSNEAGISEAFEQLGKIVRLSGQDLSVNEYLEEMLPLYNTIVAEDHYKAFIGEEKALQLENQLVDAMENAATAFLTSLVQGYVVSGQTKFSDYLKTVGQENIFLDASHGYLSFIDPSEAATILSEALAYEMKNTLSTYLITHDYGDLDLDDVYAELKTLVSTNYASYLGYNEMLGGSSPLIDTYKGTLLVSLEKGIYERYVGRLNASIAVNYGDLNLNTKAFRLATSALRFRDKPESMSFADYAQIFYDQEFSAMIDNGLTPPKTLGEASLILSNVKYRGYGVLDFASDGLKDHVIQTKLYDYTTSLQGKELSDTELVTFISNVGVRDMGSLVLADYQGFNRTWQITKAYYGQNAVAFVSNHGVSAQLVDDLRYDKSFLNPVNISRLFLNQGKSFDEWANSKRALTSYNLSLQNSFIELEDQLQLDRLKYSLTHNVIANAFEFELESDFISVISNELSDNSVQLGTTTFSSNGNFTLTTSDNKINNYFIKEINQTVVRMASMLNELAMDLGGDNEASEGYRAMIDKYKADYDLDGYNAQPASVLLAGLESSGEFKAVQQYMLDYGDDNYQLALSKLEKSSSGIDLAIEKARSDTVTYVANKGLQTDKQGVVIPGQTLNAKQQSLLEAENEMMIAMRNVEAKEAVFSSVNRDFKRRQQEYNLLYEQEYVPTLKRIRDLSTQKEVAVSDYQRAQAIYDFARSPYLVSDAGEWKNDAHSGLGQDAAQVLAKKKNQWTAASNALMRAKGDWEAEEAIVLSPDPALDTLFNELNAFTEYAIETEKSEYFLQVELNDLQEVIFDKENAYVDALNQVIYGNTNDVILFMKYVSEGAYSKNFFRYANYFKSRSAYEEGVRYGRIAPVPDDAWNFIHEHHQKITHVRTIENMWNIMRGRERNKNRRLTRAILTGWIGNWRAFKRARSDYNRSKSDFNNELDRIFSQINNPRDKLNSLNQAKDDLSALIEADNISDLKDLLVQKNIGLDHDTLSYLVDHSASAKYMSQDGNDLNAPVILSEYRAHLQDQQFKTMNKIIAHLNGKYDQANVMKVFERYMASFEQRHFMDHSQYAVIQETMKGYFQNINQAGVTQQEQAKIKQNYVWQTQIKSFESKIQDQYNRLNLVLNRGKEEWNQNIRKYISAWQAWKNESLQTIEKGKQAFAETKTKMTIERDAWIERVTALDEAGELEKYKGKLLLELEGTLFDMVKGVNAGSIRLPQAEINKIKSEFIASMGEVNTETFSPDDYYTKVFTMGELVIKDFSSQTLANLDKMIQKIVEDNEDLALAKLYASLTDAVKEGQKALLKILETQNKNSQEGWEQEILKPFEIEDSKLKRSWKRVAKKAAMVGVDGWWYRNGKNHFKRNFIQDYSMVTDIKGSTQYLKGWQFLEGYRPKENFQEISPESVLNMSKYEVQKTLADLEASIYKERVRMFDGPESVFGKYANKEGGRVSGALQKANARFFEGVNTADKHFFNMKIFPGNNAFSDFFTLSLVNTVVLAVVGAIVTAVAGPVGMAIIAGAVLLNGVMNEGVNKAYYGEDYSWEQFATGIGMAILEAAASFAMAGASAATAAASGVAKVGTSAATAAAGGAAKVGMSALSAGARVGVSVGMAAGQFLNKFLVQQTVSGFSSLKNGKLDTGKHWKNTKSFVRANVGSFAASVVGAAIGSGIGLGMDKMKFKTGFGESIVNMAVNKGLGVGMNAMAAKIDGRSYKFDPLKEFMNGSFISSAVMAGVAAGGDIKALKAANAAREMQKFNESRDGESPFDNPENRKLFATASKSGRRKILNNLEKLSGDGDWDRLSDFQKNELTWQTLNNDFDSTRLVATMKQMASRNNSMDTSNVFANNNFDSIGNVGLPRFTMTAPRNSVGTSGVSSDGNYSFASGDNPSKLAQRFGVSTDQVVASLNAQGITDMTKIPVGTRVNLNGDGFRNYKLADGTNYSYNAKSNQIRIKVGDDYKYMKPSSDTSMQLANLTGNIPNYSYDEIKTLYSNGAVFAGASGSNFPWSTGQDIFASSSDDLFAGSAFGMAYGNGLRFGQSANGNNFTIRGGNNIKQGYFAGTGINTHTTQMNKWSLAQKLNMKPTSLLKGNMIANGLILGFNSYQAYTSDSPVYGNIFWMNTLVDMGFNAIGTGAGAAVGVTASVYTTPAFGVPAGIATSIGVGNYLGIKYGNPLKSYLFDTLGMGNQHLLIPTFYNQDPYQINQAPNYWIKNIKVENPYNQ